MNSKLKYIEYSAQEEEYFDDEDIKQLYNKNEASENDVMHEGMNINDVKSDVNDLLVQLEANTVQMLAKKTEAIHITK